VLEARKAADVDDRIRSAATTICQALIEAELTAMIGACPPGRTDPRTGQRNGSRPRTLSKAAGRVVLPVAAGAPAADRAGAVRGGDGGLPARGEQ
jgi:transposase-like protein